MRKNVLLTFLVMLFATVLNASAADLNWTTVPANGSTVRVLESIQVKFDGATAVNLSDEALDGWVTATLDGEEAKIPIMGRNGAMSMRGITLTSGTYVLNLHEGLFDVTMTGGEVYSSPAMTLSWVIDPNAVVHHDVAVTYTPAAGAEVYAIEKVKLDFVSDDLTEVAFGSKVSPDGFTVTAGGVVYKYGTDFTEGDDATEMVFKTPVTALGQATVNVAEGFYDITFNDDMVQPSPACEWSFSVVEKPWDPELTLNTVPSLNQQIPELTRIKVDFAGNGLTGVSLGSAAGADGFVVTLGSKTYKYGTDFTQGSDVTEMLFSTPVTTKGYPKISIAEGFYELTFDNGEKMPSPATEWTCQIIGKTTVPVISPAEGDIFDGSLLENVVLTMASDDITLGNVSTTLNKVYLYKVAADGSLTQITLYNGKKTDSKTATFTAKTIPETWEPGDYRFVISKAGAMTMTQNGAQVTLGKMEWNWTLKEEVKLPAISPAAGEISNPSLFQTVTLTMPESDMVVGSVSTSLKKVYLYKVAADGTLTQITLYNGKKDSSNKQLAIFTAKSMPESWEDGHYRFYVTKGAMTVTQNGVKVFDDNLEYDFDLVQGAVVTPEVKWTSTPAAGAKVETLSEFSVAFEGVSGATQAADSGVTLTHGNKTLTLNNGITAAANVTTMLLDTPLTTAGEVTVTVAAGFYDLTLSDGSKQASPEMKWTFTVEGLPMPEVKYTTTPAAGEQLNGLEQFSVSFSDATDIKIADTQAGVTLKYGDKVLTYGNGLRASDNDVTAILLDTPLKQTCSVEVTVGAGFYSMTLDNVTVPSPEIKWSFTVKEVAEGEPVWVPVQNTAELETLEGKDLVIGWFYNGVFRRDPVEEAPGLQKIAPPIDNGKMSCLVMNNTQTIGGGGLIGYRGTDAAAPVLGDNDELLGLVSLPEGTAFVNISKTDKGYTIWNNNCETPGYLCPMEDMNTNRNFLNTSQTPWYNSISISDGVASVSEKTREDKNILSAIAIWSLVDESLNQTVFQYVSQSLDLGGMVILVRKSDKANITIEADPQSGSVIDAPQQPAEGKDLGEIEVKFSFRGADSAVYDSDAALTLSATFDGEPLAADRIVCDNASPATVKFYLPVNKEGKLNVVVPEGWYRLTAGTETYPSPKLNYELELKQVLNVLDLKIGLTPESGSIVSSISMIEVIMPDNVASCEINPDMFALDAEPMTATIDGVPAALPIMVDPTHFRYRPEYNTPGTYELTLSEGLYIITLNDGSRGLSPAVSTTLTVDPASLVLDVTYTTTPANRATVDGELKSFSVRFDGVEEYVLGPEANAEGLVVSIGDKTLHYGSGFSAAEDVCVMMFDEPQKAEDTTVIIDIKEGFYMLTTEDGTMGRSPAVHFSFTLTDSNALTDILGDEFNGSVYTLDGVCVLRNADKSDIKNLTPGLYVIGGKVFMIR